METLVPTLNVDRNNGNVNDVVIQNGHTAHLNAHHAGLSAQGHIRDTFSNTERLMKELSDIRKEASEHCGEMRKECEEHCGEVKSEVLKTSNELRVELLKATCEIERRIGSDGDKTRDLIQTLERERSNRCSLSKDIEIAHLKSMIIPPAP